MEKEIEVSKNETYSNIKFCSNCDSAYYSKVENKKLIYICRNCGNQEDSFNPIVHTNDYRRKEVTGKHLLNQYIKYDHTIPRTKMIKCHNCDENTEIMFFKYNPREDMALIYVCTVCETSWRK